MTGFQVKTRRHKIDGEWIEKFRAIPVANISDSMSRMTAGGTRLRPLHAGGVMAGPAVTVKTRPGDNLMLHKALDMSEPGDVIVVDAGGDLTNAMTGEMMIAYAERRGVAGFVIDGAVRDIAAIRAGSFPVYAAGVTHRGPYKDGPGEINVAIALDGMVIEPGDLMIGDDDGVLCVPIDQAADIFEKATAKHEAELKQMQAIAEGRNDRSWVDAALKRLGCAIES